MNYNISIGNFKYCVNNYCFKKLCNSSFSFFNLHIIVFKQKVLLYIGFYEANLNYTYIHILQKTLFMRYNGIFLLTKEGAFMLFTYDI